MQLDDALEVLVLMAQERDPRFDRAATRWVGRLLAEQPLGLADARYALALGERLPQCRESLHRLARGHTRLRLSARLRAAEDSDVDVAPRWMLLGGNLHGPDVSAFHWVVEVASGSHLRGLQPGVGRTEGTSAAPRGARGGALRPNTGGGARAIG
jgi:hypothetical protein